jgi:hypothetical protein
MHVRVQSLSCPLHARRLKYHRARSQEDDEEQQGSKGASLPKLVPNGSPSTAVTSPREHFTFANSTFTQCAASSPSACRSARRSMLRVHHVWLRKLFPTAQVHLLEGAGSAGLAAVPARSVSGPCSALDVDISSVMTAWVSQPEVKAWIEVCWCPLMLQGGVWHHHALVLSRGPHPALHLRCQGGQPQHIPDTSWCIMPPCNRLVMHVATLIFWRAEVPTCTTRGGGLLRDLLPVRPCSSVRLCSSMQEGYMWPP